MAGRGSSSRVPEPLRVAPLNTPERAGNAVSVTALRGGIAIVHGGAAGIGLGLLVRCVQEGMIPVVLDIDAEMMDAAAASLKAAGASEVMTLHCDAGDRAAVFAAADAVQKRFPGVPVSFLCANAGYGTPDVLNGSEADWRRGTDVLMYGVVWLLQAFKRQLLKQNPSPCVVVNTASVAGLIPGGGSYGVLKHACVAITESAYQEFMARGALHVKVHVLCPGIISTNIMQKLSDKQMASRFMQAFKIAVEQYGHTPATLAQRVFEAIEDGKFYIVVDDADSPANIDAYRVVGEYHSRIAAGEPPSVLALSNLSGRGGSSRLGELVARLQSELKRGPPGGSKL